MAGMVLRKTGGGTAYHIKVDITGGACGIETGAWDSKTVPAAAFPCYEDCADHDRRCLLYTSPSPRDP